LNFLFPNNWLEQTDESDPRGRSNREVQIEEFTLRAVTSRRQTAMAALSQISACFTHHVSADRLRAISSHVPKVLIVSGDEDYLVDVRNSAYLASAMPEAEYIVLPETGHGLCIQQQQTFNRLIERVVKEGRERGHNILN